MSSLRVLRRVGQNFGPYLMLEVLLPGGTLFALLLFLYQRRKASIGAAGAGLRKLPALMYATGWNWRRMVDFAAPPIDYGMKES